LIAPDQLTILAVPKSTLDGSKVKGYEEVDERGFIESQSGGVVVRM